MVRKGSSFWNGGKNGSDNLERTSWYETAAWQGQPFLKANYITAGESGVLIKCLLLKDDKQAVGSQASADFQDEREDMTS